MEKIFKVLNESCKYVVMWSYNTLPFKTTGQDVDMFVGDNSENLHSVLKVFRKFGFQIKVHPAYSKTIPQYLAHKGGLEFDICQQLSVRVPNPDFKDKDNRYCLSYEFNEQYLESAIDFHGIVKVVHPLYGSTFLLARAFFDKWFKDHYKVQFQNTIKEYGREWLKYLRMVFRYHEELYKELEAGNYNIELTLAELI